MNNAFSILAGSCCADGLATVSFSTLLPKQLQYFTRHERVRRTNPTTRANLTLGKLHLGILRLLMEFGNLQSPHTLPGDPYPAPPSQLPQVSRLVPRVASAPSIRSCIALYRHPFSQ